MVTHCSIPIQSLFLFLLLNYLNLLIDLHTVTANNSETSQPYVYALCNDTDPVALNSVYQENISTTLFFLVSNSSTTTSRFYNTTVGTGGDKIYGLYFCQLDVTNNVCQQNVALATEAMKIHCPRQKVAVLWYSDKCMVKYSNEPFLGSMHETLVPLPNRQNSLSPHFRVGTGQRVRSHRRSLVIGFSVAAVIITVIIVGILKFLCSRKIENPYNDCNDSETVKKLKFDLSLIRSATKNFSNDQMLGEGGFGQVFKGKLLSGQEIAVKRLSRSSRQGNNECKAEVHIVAKLQHRNLVKLLGFCLAEQEKLLIYELCSNSSLDKLLFDPVKVLSLNWSTRFKIICGIARGLLYLHEDSQRKIIHRDLKPSNVLLDNDMSPKISDFGMARLFVADETQANTDRIAGTFGYMAPEYVTAGQYSAKSDVYAFGIIILEIVSGQRNKLARTEDEESLLERAWRLWNEEHKMEFVDHRMGNNVLQEEATKCIHLGLLCIQEDEARRPGMPTVVSALNGDAIVLPSPVSPDIVMTGSYGFEEPRTHQSRKTFTGSKTITILEAR